MKIFYSINKKSLRIILNALEKHPISKLSKGDILNGLADSDIALVFDYRGQDAFVVEDALLGFFYNVYMPVNKMIAGEIDEAFTFGIEEGFSMKMKIFKKSIILESFGVKFSVDASLFRMTLKEAVKDVFVDMENLYEGILLNEEYLKIKEEILAK